MTGYVVTRWYRAPEVILSWMHYNQTGQCLAALAALVTYTGGHQAIQTALLFPSSGHLVCWLHHGRNADRKDTLQGQGLYPLLEQMLSLQEPLLSATIWQPNRLPEELFIICSFNFQTVVLAGLELAI